MSDKYLEFGINAIPSVTMYCGFQKPWQVWFSFNSSKSFIYRWRSLFLCHLQAHGYWEQGLLNVSFTKQ